MTTSLIISPHVQASRASHPPETPRRSSRPGAQRREAGGFDGHGRALLAALAALSLLSPTVGHCPQTTVDSQAKGPLITADVPTAQDSISAWPAVGMRIACRRLGAAFFSFHRVSG